MATERVEGELRRRLRELLGDVAGMALIEKFPPKGWADLPSSSDLQAFEARTAQRFDRLDRIDDRLDRVDRRLDGVDDRLDRIDGRLGRLDDRLDGVDDRLASHDVHFERIESRFDVLEQRMTATFRGELNAAITAQTRSIILGLLGAMAGVGGLSLAMAQLTG